MPSPSPAPVNRQSLTVNTSPTSTISSSPGGVVIQTAPNGTSTWLELLEHKDLNKNPGALNWSDLMKALKTKNNPSGFVEEHHSSLFGVKEKVQYKKDHFGQTSELGISTHAARGWIAVNYGLTALSVPAAAALAVGSSFAAAGMIGAAASGIGVPLIVFTGTIALTKALSDFFISPTIEQKYKKVTQFQLEQNAAGSAISRETMLVQALMAYRIVSKAPFYAKFFDPKTFDRETNSPVHTMGLPLLQAMRIVVRGWDKLNPGGSGPGSELEAKAVRDQYEEQIRLLFNQRNQFAEKYTKALMRINKPVEAWHKTVGLWLGYNGLAVTSFIGLGVALFG
jgi:hypothetical protein